MRTTEFFYSPVRLGSSACLLLLLLLGGCRQGEDTSKSSASDRPEADKASAENPPEFVPENLLEVRGSYRTILAGEVDDEEQLEIPDERIFEITAYKSAPGFLEAYLSLPVEKDRKYPAMIWVTGGFPPGGIGAQAWEPVDPANDQSAKIYRESGMIMMYPTLRGCCDNPGFQEGFYGEVDDLIAAGEYLKQHPSVDPDRIYLGGHSTGGTLVLLVAESTDLFRGVIAFGPVEDPAHYGDEYILYERGRVKERMLRAPIHYLDYIRTPTVIVEGTQGNIGSLMALQAKGSSNSNLSFVPVPHKDHFNVLSHVNAIVADRIISRPDEPLALTAADVAN